MKQVMESKYVPQNDTIHRSHMLCLWDIFEIQTENNVIYTLAKSFAFNFRINKIFSYPSAL